MMRRTIFIFIVLLVVLGLIAWVYIDNKKINDQANNLIQNNTSEEVTGDPNVEVVPENVRVPEKGEEVPDDVAPPITVDSSANLGFRRFEVNISDNKYEPENIIVKYNDNIQVVFTALDSNYDFTQPNYGQKISIAKGQTVFVNFQANIMGKFRFYCESCGGPDKGPVGYLIVAEK